MAHLDVFMPQHVIKIINQQINFSHSSFFSSPLLPLHFLTLQSLPYRDVASPTLSSSHLKSISLSCSVLLFSAPSSSTPPFLLHELHPLLPYSSFLFPAKSFYSLLHPSPLLNPSLLHYSIFLYPTQILLFPSSIHLSSTPSFSSPINSL